jgi:hypothetical protein
MAAKTKTAAKPVKPVAKPAAPAPKKTNFKVHPDDVQRAMNLIEAYITERVEAIKDRSVLNTAVAAIKVMDNFFKLKESIGSRLKTPLEEAYNTLRFTTVPTLMDDEEITTIGVDDVGRVNIQDDLSLSVKDKDALHDWLTEQDLEDMIIPSVNAQTLTAFFRGRIKEGKKQDGTGLPNPEIVEVTPFVRASITRSK